MILDLHPDIRIQKLTFGAENAPLLVIDNFVADPDKLVRRAATRTFVPWGAYFPGIRADAPLSYRQLFDTRLRGLLFDFFQLRGNTMTFPLCHYSLVTTPPEQLVMLQRIPHIDSTDGNGLASVHYLFRGNHGGTAFYRHRRTGYERVDAQRKEEYFRLLDEENAGPDAPAAAYIDRTTSQFEQIASQEGVFNRVLIYRRNSLHSGSLGKDFVPDPSPLTGRLSINSFIDLRP